MLMAWEHRCATLSEDVGQPVLSGACYFHHVLLDFMYLILSK